MKIVLATANPGKQREFAALLGPRGFELVLQSELHIDGIAETGHTFEDNALLKARHAAALSGLPALADDSGLEVNALGGRPGVWSALIPRSRSAARVTGPTTATRNPWRARASRPARFSASQNSRTPT